MEGEGAAGKVRVGYFLSKHKISRLPWDQIVAVAASRNMEMVEMDLDNGLEALEKLGRLDLIITKVTDDLVRQDIPKHVARIQTLEKYLAAHPEVVDAEPLAKQRAVINRELISKLLEQIDSSINEDLKVKCPHFAIINNKADDYSQELRAANVQLPVIVKTVQACGTTESHFMGIVFNEAGLHADCLVPPLVVQEYFSHNAVVFKVFALEDTVDIVRRPSLRNVRHDETKDLLFNSQVPLPAELYDPARDAVTQEAWPNPPIAVLKEINTALRNQLGLALLGFDVVTSVETGKHAVIDVNYFPGYGGISNFPELFVDFLQQRLLKRK